MALRPRKAVEEAYSDVRSTRFRPQRVYCWVHSVADLLTRFDAEEAVGVMATVVCDAAAPTTEAELTRTRRFRGQGRQAGLGAATGHGQPPG